MDTGLPDADRQTGRPHPYGSAAAPRPPVRRGVLVRKLVVMTLILALLLGGLYAFNRYRQQAISEFFAANKPPPVPVAAVPARAEPAPHYLSGIGTLAAVRQVVLSPEVGGRVTEIHFQPGASVAAGDPLLQLNDAPEQANLLGFRAQARLAETSLSRARELLQRQAGTQVTVDQAQAQLDQARADIQKTEALIAQKLIRAPFAGQLGVRQVNLGQVVNPGDPIVTLTDLDRLYVNFTLPEQTRSRVAVGQEVLIDTDAFPGQTFKARITTIEPQVSADLRMIKIQATLDNPERLLLPGMFANARVVLPPQPAVVTVPETAVDYTLYGDSLFVIREDGKDAEGNPVLRAERVYVQTGSRFDGRVAILKGVEPGALVASSGQLKLSSGALVTLAPQGGLTPPETIPAQ